MTGGLVLVTGASGFVGAHCVKVLFERGYKIRGTVRNVERDRESLEQLAPNSIEVIECDLTNSTQNDWDAVANGCDFCLHVASPYFSPLTRKAKDPEKELIEPAMKGTRVVLQACVNGGVKRVVLTSSLAAVMAGRNLRSPGVELTTDMYSNTDPKTRKTEAYPVSKALAEKLAWDEFGNNGLVELSTMCPGGVYGPLLLPKRCESAAQVKQMSKLPIALPMSFPAVDVRDLALGHVVCLEKPESVGKRFFIGQGIEMAEGVIAARKGAGQDWYSPLFVMPPWMFKYSGLRWLSGMGNYTAFGKTVIDRDMQNWRQVLGITQFRDGRDAIRDMAKSMKEFKML